MVFLLSVLSVLLFVGLAITGYLWWNETGRRQLLEREATAEKQKHSARIDQLQVELKRLSAWEVVGDAEVQARKILADAGTTLDRANADAARLNTDAAERTRTARAEAQALVESASARAKAIVDEAESKATAIAGDALEAVRNADFYRKAADAMRNKIKGYGDEYLVPPSSFLDSLAEQFSHKDAGRELKAARDRTRQLVKLDRAAGCEYVDSSRREGAANFVLDAFNGKVDSILSRVREDNAGKLEQEIRDAFQLVNLGGRAFRDARITEEYLSARLDELRWAATAQLLRKEEMEEQRRLREKMRDEERARREYEKEIRESQKEEDLLRKAMEKAQVQVAQASAAERAKLEAQLEELRTKLTDAEQRNQRAISMAQQTKRGNVYIISNIGSFGDGVFKIGMTRRLDPMDRVWELGDSSVPFDFDVHAFIATNDAPALEYQLHRHFVMNQINKVNYRKEFFRATIAEIRSQIESMGFSATWTMSSEAREYRESQAIERLIAEDPAARQAWLDRQLTLDPTSFDDVRSTNPDDDEE
jgi:hypothetical protein